MRKVFKLRNLDCANCAAKMERAIAKLEGWRRFPSILSASA